MKKSLPPLAPAHPQVQVRRVTVSGALPIELLLVAAAFVVLIFG